MAVKFKSTVPTPISMESLLGKVTRSKIDLNPSYQRRGGIWKKIDERRFISALIRGLPIDPLYISYSSSDPNHTDVGGMADGKQRTTVVKKFTEDKILLTANDEKVVNEFLQTDFKLKNRPWSQLDSTVKELFLDREMSFFSFNEEQEGDAQVFFQERNTHSNSVISKMQVLNAKYDLSPIMPVLRKYDDAYFNEIEGSRSNLSFSLLWLALPRNKVKMYYFMDLLCCFLGITRVTNITKYKKRATGHREEFLKLSMSFDVDAVESCDEQIKLLLRNMGELFGDRGKYKCCRFPDDPAGNFKSGIFHVIAPALSLYPAKQICNNISAIECLYAEFFGADQFKHGDVDMSKTYAADLLPIKAYVPKWTEALVKVIGSPGERKAIPRSLVHEVSLSSKFCGICGEPMHNSGTTACDHKVPVAVGGGNDLDNLQPTHSVCNLSKGAKLLSKVT